MRRYSLIARRLVLALSCSLVASLAVVASAQATVLNVSGIQQSSPYDQGPEIGVAPVPGTTDAQLGSTGAQVVEPGGSCSIDAPLASLLTVSDPGLLCYEGGPVIHSNETFALVWDPNPYKDYAASYVEQFMRNVADASGSLTSPYAVTGEYAGPDQTTGVSGTAANSSAYGGGYDDTDAYPAQVCNPSGIHHYYLQTDGIYTDVSNDVCVTDAQIKNEVAAQIVARGLNQPGAIQPGSTPILNVLLPPGVVTCIDAASNLCSANAAAPGTDQAQFCSYHSQLSLNGKAYDYVVLPWTAQTGCDDDDADQPQFPSPVVDPGTLANDMGSRLVSPLSQADIATITDPAMNGWFNVDNGAEVNDNTCIPLSNNLDLVTVNGFNYWLQREFNNAGAVVNDPFALACTPSIALQPTFVVPSAVNEGDTVEFDGSKSPTTLLIPDANYAWTFGDGTSATGPSVTHSYGAGGTYNVTLKVTDRGDDVETLTQPIVVLGSNGSPVSPPGTNTGGGSNGLNVRLQLMPQSLKIVLRNGISLRVTSNKPANGIATVFITRAAARKAGIKVGHSPSIRIGLGTVSSIKDGTVSLRLHLSKTVVKRLRRLHHVAMTIRMALVASGNQRIAVVAAASY